MRRCCRRAFIRNRNDGSAENRFSRRDLFSGVLLARLLLSFNRLVRRIAVSSTRFFSFPRQPLFLAVALFVTAPHAWSAEESPAMTALRQRADSGDGAAMNALGDAFANGDGVRKDDAAALRYYKQAAARGHAPALYTVGSMLEAGRGARADRVAAFQSFVKSAEQGWPPAQLKVAEMFSAGVGTARDDNAAAIWYRKAALNGLVEAQYNLALAYEQGRGVPKDRQQAQKWYRDAADRGDARARFSLALMLEGGLGSAPDAVAAAELYRTAAEQGFAPAQNNYGLLLAEGRGSVEANLVESYAWLTIAVENGANAAGRNLVAQKLDPAQLAAAMGRASELRARLAGGPVSAEPKNVVEVTSATEPHLTSAAPSPVVAASPVESASVAQTKPVERVVVAPSDAEGLARVETQLAVATQEISALKAEQGKLYQSSAQIVVDLSELLSSAAEAVKARGLLATAEQKVRDAERANSQESLVAAKREVEALRVRAASALNKWSDRVTHLSSEFAQVRTPESHPTPAPTAVAVDTSPVTKPAAVTPAEDPALKAEIAQLEARVKDLSAGSDAMRDEQDRLRKENTKLATELRSAEEANAAAARAPAVPAEWMKERETLQAQIRDTANKLSEAEQRAEQLKQADVAAKDAEVRVTAAKTENAELVSRVAALTETNEKMRREQDRLGGENAKLTVEKQAAADSALAAERALVAPADWKKEREALRLQVQELTTKFADAEQQTSQLKKTSDAAREEAATAKSEAEKIRAELATANEQGRRVGELTAALEKLSKENTDLQKQTVDLQKQLVGVDALRAESSRVAELEKTLAAAQQRVASLESTDAKFAAAQRDLAGLKAENGRLTSSAQAQEQDRRNQVARLQQENTALAARLRQAQGTLDQIASAARVNGGVITPFVAPPSASQPVTGGVAAPAISGRFYTVAEGDSLTRISIRYYGTGSRWQEIYDANRDVLRGQTALRVGQQLRVP